MPLFRRLLVIAILAALTVPASATAQGVSGAIPQRPTSTTTWVGQLVAPVSARTHPNPRARQIMALQPIAPFGGGITTLMITDRRPGADGRL